MRSRSLSEQSVEGGHLVQFVSWLQFSLLGQSYIICNDKISAYNIVYEDILNLNL